MGSEWTIWRIFELFTDILAEKSGLIDATDHSTETALLHELSERDGRNDSLKAVQGAVHAITLGDEEFHQRFTEKVLTKAATVRNVALVVRALTDNDRLADPENVDLARQVFSAKDVPPLLISKIAEQREFHRPDWPAVRASVAGLLYEFDFYFDFVIAESSMLKSLWVV
jgi:hypothetical protein